MDKKAGYTFAIASIAMLVAVVSFISLVESPDVDWQLRIANLNEQWLLISSIWRIEAICVIALSWAAFHFAKSDSAWYLVGIGHILMLTEYAVMLAGYPEVKTEEGFMLMNQLALWIFATSNFIWLIGMALVYTRFFGWIKYAGIILASISATGFFGIFLGILTMKHAMLAGPLAALLYVLNAWVGVRYLTSSSLEGQLESAGRQPSAAP